MAKQRPHAQIYSKWLSGIYATLQDEHDRYMVIQYIIDYQLSEIYGVCDSPSMDNLSFYAKVCIKMLMGDLQELCEVRRERIKQSRENGRKKNILLKERYRRISIWISMYIL